MINFSRLDESLHNQHPSLSELENPVLLKLRSTAHTHEEVASILGQYSLLPKRIVSILSSIRDKVDAWSRVSDALDENIAEECGIATGGLAHYKILRTALQRELGLDITDVVSAPYTEEFFTRIFEGIAAHPSPFSAGMVYALEASAHPELRIITRIINAYASLSKPGVIPIREEALDDKSLCDSILKDKPAVDYSLEDFFVVHLQEFEVGHRDDLQDVLGKYVKSEDSVRSLYAGYEFILDLMDQWWVAMSRELQVQIGANR